MSDDLPFGSHGGIAVRHQFPVDGEYHIKVAAAGASCTTTSSGWASRISSTSALDGALLKRFTIGGEAKGMTMPESFAGNTQGDPELEEYMHTADRGPRGARAGEGRAARRRRLVRAGASGSRKACCSRRRRGFARTTNELYFGYPAVETVSIGGPFSVTAPGESPSRRADLRVPSERRGGTEEPCATQDSLDACDARVSPPGHRAEIDDAARLLQGGPTRKTASTPASSAASSASWPRPASCSASSGASVAAAGPLPLNDIELASRLSFFLWSSIPDDELLNAAIAASSSDPAVLEQQVRRMLRDPRVEGAGRQLRDPLAASWASSTGVVPDTRALSANSTRTCARRCGRRRELFVGDQLRRGSQRRGSADARTTRSSTSAWRGTTAIPERLRQPLPQGDVRRRQARRTARSGERADA